jgi:hypothetical protein
VQPLVYTYLNLLLPHARIGHVEEMNAATLKMSIAWMQIVKLSNAQKVVFLRQITVKLNVKTRSALNYNVVMKLVLQVLLIYVVNVQRIWQHKLMFVIIKQVVLLMNVAYKHVLQIQYHVVPLQYPKIILVALFVLHLHANAVNAVWISARAFLVVLAITCPMKITFVLLEHVLRMNAVHEQHVQ